MSSSVARHYDSLSVRGRGARAAGPAFELKRAHNALKRDLLAEFAGGAGLLVDVGCGRGGDVAKWRDAGVRRVLGVDVSPAQLAEAKRRAEEAGLGDRYVFGPVEALGTVAAGSADVVSCMFALNYFFGADFFRTAARLLGPGGRLVGVCADGERVAELLARGPTMTRAYSLSPGSREDAYRLRISDTVLEADDGGAPEERAVRAGDLARLAAEAGLAPIPGARRAPHLSSIRDPDYRRISGVYTSFGFLKPGAS